MTNYGGVIGCLRGEMVDLDLRMPWWYQDRDTVEARMRFVARCVKRTIIWVAMHAMNAVTTELDELMRALVGWSGDYRDDEQYGLRDVREGRAITSSGESACAFYE